MIKVQRTIIGENEKVKICFQKKISLVKREKIYKEIEILCQREEDKELYLILGWMLTVQVISLKDGVIECFFKDKNVWAKRSEVQIFKQSELYHLLKKMAE